MQQLHDKEDAERANDLRQLIACADKTEQDKKALSERVTEFEKKLASANLDLAAKQQRIDHLSALNLRGQIFCFQGCCDLIASFVALHTDLNEEELRGIDSSIRKAKEGVECEFLRRKVEKHAACCVCMDLKPNCG